MSNVLEDFEILRGIIEKQINPNSLDNETLMRLIDMCEQRIDVVEKRINIIQDKINKTEKALLFLNKLQ